jgi:hypothetical protein
MSEQSGTIASAQAYNPCDHLLKLATKQGVKDYYPRVQYVSLNMYWQEGNASSLNAKRGRQLWQ